MNRSKITNMIYLALLLEYIRDRGNDSTSGQSVPKLGIATEIESRLNKNTKC